MSLFKEIEGDSAVIYSAGVFKQVPLYTRNGFLFAGAFGGFIRLKADGSTSKPSVKLDHIEIEQGLYQDRLGRLGVREMPNSTVIASDAIKLLTHNS